MAPPTHTSIVPYIFLSGDVHIVRVLTDTRFDHYLTVFNVLQEKEKGGRSLLDLTEYHVFEYYVNTSFNISASKGVHYNSSVGIISMATLTGPTTSTTTLVLEHIALMDASLLTSATITSTPVIPSSVCT